MTKKTWQTMHTPPNTTCPHRYLDVQDEPRCRIATRRKKTRCTFEDCLCRLFTYIEDGLPEPGVDVLAAWVNEIGSIIVERACYYPDDGWCYLGSTPSIVLHRTVYAWALLPDAPEVRGK